MKWKKSECTQISMGGKELDVYEGASDKLFITMCAYKGVVTAVYVVVRYGGSWAQRHVHAELDDELHIASWLEKQVKGLRPDIAQSVINTLIELEGGLV